MTLHTAKGLEFENVFIVGAEDGLLPHERSNNKDEDEIEEERRLFYVALTRAKSELYLLYPLVVDRGGHRRTLMKPSRYLKEIDQDEVVEHWSVE